jgi:hypothetical protein
MTLLTDQQLLTVVNTLYEAALDGDVKAASTLLSHFVAKPKPRAISTPYKTLDDVRNAFNLGILTSEEVISTLTALNLLTKDVNQLSDLLLNDEMVKYLQNKA